MPRGVYPRTPKIRAAIAAARRGTKSSAATREKLSRLQRQHAKDHAWISRVSTGTRKRMYDPDVRDRHVVGVKRALARTPHNRNFTGAKGEPPSPFVATLEKILAPAGYVRDAVNIVYGPRGRHYTLDFAHLTAKVDIEVDGSSHRNKERRVKDQRRDAFLRSLGWKIIRIKL